MTAKEFFMNTLALENSIRVKKARLEVLKELVTALNSPLSDMPRPETPDPQRLEGTMTIIADLEKEIEEDTRSLAAAKSRIAESVSKIQDHMQFLILTKRYIEGKSWTRICDDLDIGKRWALRQHGRALAKIENDFK